jgi:hypothetical protein
MKAGITRVSTAMVSRMAGTTMMTIVTARYNKA